MGTTHSNAAFSNIDKSEFKKYKIAVLAGGMSSERSVSLNTGKALLESLQRMGYNSLFIDVDQNLPTVLKNENIDIALLALHGTYGEDGCIQGILEFLKIPYTGSSLLSSTLSFDKAVARKFLESSDIPVAKGFILNSSQIPSLRKCLTQSELKNKIVIKPSCSGSSVGVAIIDNQDPILKTHLNEAFRYSDQVIVEQYLEGKELTIPIYQNKPVGIMEIVPEKGHDFYNFNSKYDPGGSSHLFPAQINADLESQMLKMAEQVHNLFQCNFYSRVDFKLNNEEQPFVLEINTLPGITATSLFPEVLQKAGVSFDTMIENILFSARLFIK